MLIPYSQVDVKFNETFYIVHVSNSLPPLLLNVFTICVHIRVCTKVKSRLDDVFV